MVQREDGVKKRPLKQKRTKLLLFQPVSKTLLGSNRKTKKETGQKSLNSGEKVIIVMEKVLLITTQTTS